MGKWSEEVGDFLDDIEKENRIVLRDQFAMAALPNAIDMSAIDAAHYVYAIADAMLATRDK